MKPRVFGLSLLAMDVGERDVARHDRHPPVVQRQLEPRLLRVHE